MSRESFGLAKCLPQNNQRIQQSNELTWYDNLDSAVQFAFRLIENISSENA